MGFCFIALVITIVQHLNRILLKTDIFSFILNKQRWRADLAVVCLIKDLSLHVFLLGKQMKNERQYYVGQGWFTESLFE